MDKLSSVHSKKWYKLDNAAKIYPASMSKKWTALFRVSATLNEKIDPVFLQDALERTAERFPGLSLKLKRGFFWYYLEQLEKAPRIQKDVSNPCVRMDLDEKDAPMYRVRYHENRIAVEIFHVLCDGTGGMCFLKTLVAEYIQLKYGEKIPRGETVLDCDEPPREEELEDSFDKYSRKVTMSRREAAAYRIKGTNGDSTRLNIITGMTSADAVKKKAKEYGVTVTEFLTSVLVMAIYRIEQGEHNPRKRNMPVKISVPVNLRNYYPSKTLRNFSSFVNPGIEPRFGEYSFEEVLKQIKSLMGLETSKKMMNARMSTNVVSEQNALIRVAPLFIKNPTLNIAHRINGDRTSSTTISNLGVVKLPKEMEKHVERIDFLLGSLKFNPVACACATYKDLMCISFSRTIKEADVERNFFTYLVRLGIPVKIESNRRD